VSGGRSCDPIWQVTPCRWSFIKSSTSTLPNLTYMKHSEVGERTTVMTEEVMIVDWSGTSKCLKLVHPLTTDVAAVRLIIECQTWSMIMHASLLTDMHTYCTCYMYTHAVLTLILHFYYGHPINNFDKLGQSQP